jgi:hypothetical protein
MMKRLLTLLLSVTLAFAPLAQAVDTYNTLDAALYPTTYGTVGQCWTSNGGILVPTWQFCSGGGGGSIGPVSVVSANGFAGSVANPTSTPTITISTTVTGLTLGNGTSLSAYGGTSCTNQFPRSLNASGAATCASVAVGSDVSGFGTGVATALGTNVGSAGALVTFNGAGGTPSSVTLTNATGFPYATGGTGVIPNGNTTAASANTLSAIVARDGSGNFTAGTITAALTGNASTATALAANPTDCAADNYATTIAANGNLTCATVTNAGLAGSIALSKLATQAADSVVQNATGGSAAPTAVAMPTSGTNGCAGGSNALTYNTTTHAWGCNTISGSGTVNSGTSGQLAYYASSTAAVSGNAQMNISGSTLTLGVAASTTGGLSLTGATSGTVNILPNATAGTYNFNLPQTAGTAGQVLTSGGGAATPTTWSNFAALSGSLTDGGAMYTDGTSVKSGAALTNHAVVVGTGAAGSGPKAIAALTNGQLVVGATGADPAPQTVSGSGDCGTVTLSAAGVLATTCTKTNGTSFSTLATTTPGTGIATALAVNTGSAGAPSIIIAKGTSAMGTSAITSGTCASVVTTAATGTATTDVVNWGFNGDPTGVTGYAPSASGMLTIISYPSSDNVNFKVCNNLAVTVTPTSLTLNWIVVR